MNDFHHDKPEYESERFKEAAQQVQFRQEIASYLSSSEAFDRQLVNEARRSVVTFQITDQQAINPFGNYANQLYRFPTSQSVLIRGFYGSATVRTFVEIGTHVIYLSGSGGQVPIEMVLSPNQTILFGATVATSNPISFQAWGFTIPETVR